MERTILDEKNRILEVIGFAVLGIEHIGSTSIKGVKAKPNVGTQHNRFISITIGPIRFPTTSMVTLIPDCSI
ncbi:GrpB family protein [Lysinibacillus sp. FSL M8-0355]|uniref:GrpB family protein n=1 Tax=Lysinibacillus sp. FSL M8-0355 TaxID=2921719 RepID=UPI0030FCE8E8